MNLFLCAMDNPISKYLRQIRIRSLSRCFSLFLAKGFQSLLSFTSIFLLILISVKWQILHCLFDEKKTLIFKQLCQVNLIRLYSNNLNFFKRLLLQKTISYVPWLYTTHTHTHTHIYIYIYIYFNRLDFLFRLYIYIYINRQTDRHTHTHTHTCGLYIYTHTHTHTHSETYTHTHTHTHIYICVCVCVGVWFCWWVCLSVCLCVGVVFKL